MMVSVVGLLHLSFLAFSQDIIASRPAPARTDWSRMGLTLAPSLNICKFTSDNTMFGGLRIVPLRVSSLGLAYIKSFSTHFAFDAGISVSRIGVKTAFYSNYNGNNSFAGKRTTITSFGLITVPVGFTYSTRKNSLGNNTYFKLGCNFMTIPNFGNGTIISTSGFYDRNTGKRIEETISRKESSVVAPSILIGIGKTKTFPNAMMLSYGIFFNQGFSYIGKEWDYSLVLSGATYSNKIGNKGTYIGLEAKLLFQPWGYKRYKKALDKFNATQ